MSDNTFHLKVFSGRGLEFEADTELTTVPSAVGEIGFLPNHCDFVGLLDVGIVECQVVGQSKPEKLVVAGGLCTFSNNTLCLLADSVDLKEGINPETYGKDREELSQRNGMVSQLDPEFEQIKLKLGRIEAIDRLIGVN